MFDSRSRADAAPSGRLGRRHDSGRAPEPGDPDGAEPSRPRAQSGTCADVDRQAANPPAAPAAPVPSAPSWSSCPECWGQRRIIEFRPAPNGEGPVPVVTTCCRCLGIGEVLR